MSCRSTRHAIGRSRCRVLIGKYVISHPFACLLKNSKGGHLLGVLQSQDIDLTEFPDFHARTAEQRKFTIVEW